MKKIKFLIFFVFLNSCNQYFGQDDRDYKPKNESTEIFSNVKNDIFISEIKFGDIIFPKVINPSLMIDNLEIVKIINTDKNSVVNFLNEKIYLSKGKSIYIIDDINKNNIFEYKLNLIKDEKVLHFFEYKDEIYIITNRSRLLVTNSQNVLEVANYDVFTNITPILLDQTLIIFSVFGDIYEIKLDDISILLKDNLTSNPAITIKSNVFEDQTYLYYLFNAGTLVTFDKNKNEYHDNYILDDLNILSSLGVFNELVDSPFSHNQYLYFLDRTGKIAVYNPTSSDILWELDIHETILSYLFSDDGYLTLMTFDKILIISNYGNIINSFTHKIESPISIFSIQGNIHLISEDGISKLNLNDQSKLSFYKNKFTSNLDIYYQGQNIYFKDDKSLFKLSE